MTIASLAHRLSLLALFAAPAFTALPAQDVYLSEIRADAGESWIELHNRGSAPVDIGTWSLHHSTHTVGLPQSYWWPFPIGTVLAPDAFLRVHWFQAAPAQPAAGNLYTGSSPYGFLFGLGGEPLAPAEGAIALFRSQSNSMMNTASIIEDWVGWGLSGYQREPLAVTAGRWTAGRAAPSLPTGSSLARDPAAIGTTTFADETWFVDGTPTPMMPNVTGAVLESYGSGCTLPGNHLLGPPNLHATSLPLLGNQQFALGVDNTTGIYGEFVLVAFGAAAAPAAQPSILPSLGGIGCQQAIDPTQIVLTWLLPAQIVSTSVPMPLGNYPPAVAGTELHVQAVVLDLLPNTYLPYQGVSNGLRVVIGQ